MQTPQTFDYGRLMAAHRRAQAEAFAATDDAMLFEHYYGAVCLVTADGAERNRKLTTKQDFEALSRAPRMRVGQGYDAHRLAAGRRPEDTPVRTIMTNTVVSARPDMDVGAAASLMARRQVRRLPVVEDGRLCGMVTLGDLCRDEQSAPDATDALSEITGNVAKW